MDARVVIVGWLLWLGAPPALAQDPARRWRGAWQVEGQTCWRHVGGPDDALTLEGRLGDLDVRLHGRGDARGLSLAGVAERVGGEPAVWSQHAMRLEARAVPGGALEVTLDVAGEGPRRERWVKPTTPRLTVRTIGGARASADGPCFEPGARDLVLEVVVEGRPVAVALQVLAAPDDQRYEHLGGLVHHVDLAGGAPLPVGRHRVTWSGADRSWAERPLLPGRYRITVVSSDEPLGPPPGEAAPPQSALVLVVPDAPDRLASREAPADRQDGGLASRLDPTGARASR